MRLRVSCCAHPSRPCHCHRVPLPGCRAVKIRYEPVKDSSEADRRPRRHRTAAPGPLRCCPTRAPGRGWATRHCQDLQIRVQRSAFHGRSVVPPPHSCSRTLLAGALRACMKIMVWHALSRRWLPFRAGWRHDTEACERLQPSAPQSITFSVANGTPLTAQLSRSSGRLGARSVAVTHAPKCAITMPVVQRRRKCINDEVQRSDSARRKRFSWSLTRLQSGSAACANQHMFRAQPPRCAV